ncbi:MAG: energy-coupling factor ABC transporter permease [Rhodocyclaceae bacterium]|nr:energy-coupling factor ABC transporter permease [Rhodocyclaceae bacterium]MCL4759141.1 energy-coupling factor ABC transporter permease [Rhodocyclaceae bacterium]
MHIPDGLLSPQTWLPAFAIAVPLWALGARRLAHTMGDAVVPRLAVFTALAFLMSTLMVPLPGGTSGHAVGVSLLTLVFGPWPAFMAYSLVLLLQALVIGAGGVTALPVNALAMGFVGAWTTVGCVALLGRLHHEAAIAVAAVASILLSALIVALVLGLQPWIASAADGSPRFFPFGPAVTVPAILIPHLFLAAGEAALTVLILRHARKRHWVGVTTP